MLKKLAICAFIFLLASCSARNDGRLIPQTTAESAIAQTNPTSIQHFLYATVLCASAPQQLCIDTFEYNPRSRTLRLLRRLEIPVNAQSFAVDSNNDIVV